LKQQPEDEEALKIRATLYLEGGERAAIQSASEIYERLLKRNARDSKLHYGLAWAYQLQHRLALAKFEYGQALRFNPDFVAARLAWWRSHWPRRNRKMRYGPRRSHCNRCGQRKGAASPSFGA